MSRVMRIWLCMLPAVLASCESCVPSGEQYVDVTLERSELVALHDPPDVIVRTAGGLDLVQRTDNGNSSSETEHLRWAEPAAHVLSAIRGAQYISVERDGAIEYLAVHRGAAELPETALVRDGEGWRIVRRLSIGMRRDHAVVARWDDGRLQSRRHPAAGAWIEELKKDIGDDAEAERVSKAVVALGADATELVGWYFERERADADELVTALAALCTGDVDLAQRIAPRERDPELARCMRLPDGSAKVCGRGAWVRVGDDDSRSSPSPQGEALREIDPPTDAIAGALSLCGGPRVQTHLQRGLAAMLAGNIEVGWVLRHHHEPEVLQRAVQKLDAASRPTARLLLGLEQDEAEAARAMSSPALVPTLAALECFHSTLQADGFVLYDPERDGSARIEAMLADGPLASRIVAYSILPALGPDADAEVAEARGRAIAQLYVDLSAPDAEVLPRMNTLYRCSYVPRWPLTRGGMSREGGSSPEILMWDIRIGLMERVAELPESREIDALLSTAGHETLRWAAAYVRTGASESTELLRRAEKAICRCDVRQIREFGSPGASECGFIDSAARRHGARVDWRDLAANAGALCDR